MLYYKTVERKVEVKQYNDYVAIICSFFTLLPIKKTNEIIIRMIENVSYQQVEDGIHTCQMADGAPSIFRCLEFKFFWIRLTTSETKAKLSLIDI